MVTYRMFRAKIGFLSLCFALLPFIAFSQKLDMKKFEGMKARSIGPAGMSGRVTAADAVHAEPDIIYLGTASGGLWKSTNGGIDWQPIFDDQPVASIGSISIYQKSPDIVYVGTGEGNPRNSQASGNGVYKTLDGGKSWIHLGLENSRNIHRIIVHPENPDIVFAGVIGSAWGDTEERGVYKSTDGGKTWRRVLYANNRTGVAEMVMDPQNPNKLFAAMWEYRRWPWFFKSGGPGSGLYVTFDGGETWKKRTDADGLPKGELGRMGIAIARSNPDIVYALIEAKKTALYRSDDGGFKWKKITDKNVGNRPFYYCEIYVDPQNENRLYSIHSRVSMSEDGGKTFKTFVPSSRVHPDHHTWWIHPDDPDFIIDGNDGGAAISRDRGKSWRFVENLPLAQFYHINVDMDIPYHVMGGMQDNGSWRGPNTAWRAGGIRNAYWEELAFGDGFDVVPDRTNPDRFGYAMSQGGNVVRYDLKTGNSRYIKPVHPDGVYLRFNWNAGIAADPFDAKTIYYGSQFLHKSTDRGDTWEIISPDLTTNDPEKQKQLDSGGLTYDVTNAENFTTIISIAPSPKQQGVIWVGTDDGNVQLTQDGGKTWTNVVKKIKGVPAGTWVPQIQASTYSAGEAFVMFDNHRRNDWTPYVYYTKNFGKSWSRLAQPEQVWGYALALAQDPVAPNLLFLGTEFGLYVSIDFGKNWTKWTQGLPTVSTMDLVIHPREQDLVIGTFGRAAYVLDDIRPLRALARDGAALLDRKLVVFEAPDAYLASYKQAAGTRFAAEAKFSGKNRPYGALISYAVNPDTGAPTNGKSPAAKKAAKDVKKKPAKVKVEILDADNNVIRTLKGEAKPGINRVAWSLNRKGVRPPMAPKPKPDAPERGGRRVLPGTYNVRVSYAGAVDSTTVDVLLDPRLDIPLAELKTSDAFAAEMEKKVAVATEAMDRLREAESTLKTLNARLKDRSDDQAKAVKKKGKAVQDSIKALKELFVGKQVQGIRRDPATLVSQIFTASRYLRSGYAPGRTEQIAARQAELALKNVLTKVNAFFEKDWAAFKQAVDAAHVSFFKAYKPLSIE